MAAWFLDSDYDSRCFCITQAFFPRQDAWEKIAKADKQRMYCERALASLDALLAKEEAARRTSPTGEGRRVVQHE